MTWTPPSHDERDARMTQLTELFGSYKAEWLDQRVYELFARPAYFPYLSTNQSCVLLGGRGTGKTTVLKGLSYEGQQRLTASLPPEWSSYGVYYKVDSEHLSAFKGGGRTDDEWQRPFGHHLNLLFSDLVLRFLVWYQTSSPRDSPVLDTRDDTWRVFEQTLDLKVPEERTYTIPELAQCIRAAFIEFGLYINNIDDEGQARPRMSVVGGGISALFEAVSTLAGFERKTFYLLIDEYESMEDYQQRVCNTLIKQSAGRPYCFKIGVRELGWRERYTLNGQELRDPSDYRRVDIGKELGGKEFSDFAYEVFMSRFSRLVEGTDSKVLGVQELFPSLTLYEEADELGVRRQADPYLKEADRLPEGQAAVIRGVHPALVWFAVKWGEGEGWGVIESLNALASSPSEWEYRFEQNYGYASLFAIRQGKTRKYYAGWDLYIKLASGNIRFFLQLVEEALKEQIRRNREFSTPIDPKAQTDAARNVGLKNFEELEGLDVRGARIMKLLLGVGRLFQIMAWYPFRHAPELNQFTLDEHDEAETLMGQSEETLELLKASVNHLALQRAGGTKLGRQDPRGFDYWIHPIYSAFFQISHRRKRKTTLTLEELYDLATDQSRAILPILKRHGRSGVRVDEVPLPSQLDLFYPPPGTES